MKKFSTTKGGWVTRRVAEVWTGHLTATDIMYFSHVVPEDLKSTLPGYICSYPEGWYAFIPTAGCIKDHLTTLANRGLSKVYLAITMDLCKSGITIARFDADAASNMEFEIFYNDTLTPS